MPTPKTIALGAAIPVALVAGIAAGGHPDVLPGFARDALVNDSSAQMVGGALDAIEGDYFRKLPGPKLVDAAIGGVVGSLGDQFSNYFTPAEYARFRNDTNSRFQGIGVSVRQAKLGLLIVDVYDGSPAKDAGIHAGDVITAAAGKRLAGKPDMFSTALIRGQPGTSVKLVVARGGHERTLNVMRATVDVPVVTSKLRTLPGTSTTVGQVALAMFSSGAHGEVKAAVDRELKQGAKAIILDLRHNGGGLVEESRLVASVFIPEGTIVSTRGRTQPSRTLPAAGDAISPKIPVVVLVDGETASASEIVTGALQDRRRATVVGTHTFGKGVFQEVKELPNGGALDITVGEYFTPNGRNLGGGGVRRGAGVKPDVLARDDPKKPGDEALRAALKVLASKLP